MILIYKKADAATIRKGVKTLLPKITKFFKDNPKRKDCKVEFFYGVSLVLKPDTFEQQLKEAAETAIKG